MKLQFTKIVEDRSQVLVAKALEKSLKREAWEIHRQDNHMVALGFGPSRNAVNLADKATFDIDSSEGATTVQVEAEYQYTWFLSEESQDDTVQIRIESVFANMRAELDLAPERLNAQSEAEVPPKYISATPTYFDAAISASEAAAPPRLAEKNCDPAPLTSFFEVEKSCEEPTIAFELQEASKDITGPSKATRRFGFAAARLTAASILVALCVSFGISHSRARRITDNATKPAPPVPAATQIPVPSPAIHLTPLHSLPAEPTLPHAVPAKSDAQSQEIMSWLEEWAASERTRDAKTQAGFYADDVRPYLTLDHASRSVVYQSKQDTIDNRKGLWTFKIDGVAVRQASGDEASVLIKKVVMTQTNSVEISEKRIFSFLTLKRAQGVWRITGERDLR